MATESNWDQIACECIAFKFLRRNELDLVATSAKRGQPNYSHQDNDMSQRLCLSLLACLALSFQVASAETLESQSNPVDTGTIKVAADDADRSDWDEVPWFEFDDDFSDFYPVDIDRVQVAHDATHMYMHVTALEWDTEDAWRVGIYLDTDTDFLTGYTGGFLPLGADYLFEGTGAFEFVAVAQEDWGWEPAGDIVRDQSTMLDFELAVPRSVLGNPTSVDFILIANNTFGEVGTADDIYPNDPGFVWTYELGESETLPGDFNLDGLLDAMDIDALGVDVASMSNTALYDLTNDQITSVADIEQWLQIRGSLNGDADLSGDVAFNDFLVLSSGFGSAASWTGGDFDGNGTVEFADFLVLSSNFGQSAAAQSVPEPTSTVMWSVTFMLLGAFRSKRHRNRTEIVCDS